MGSSLLPRATAVAPAVWSATSRQAGQGGHLGRRACGSRPGRDLDLAEARQGPGRGRQGPGRDLAEAGKGLAEARPDEMSSHGSLGHLTSPIMIVLAR